MEAATFEWRKRRRRSVLRSCSSRTTRPFSSRWGTTANSLQINRLGRQQSPPRGRGIGHPGRRRPLVHHQAAGVSVQPGRAGRRGHRASDGCGGRDGPLVTPLQGCCGATVATQRCVTASPLRRNAPLRSPKHWSLTNIATACSRAFRSVEAASA